MRPTHPRQLQSALTSSCRCWSPLLATCAPSSSKYPADTCRQEKNSLSDLPHCRVAAILMCKGVVLKSFTLDTIWVDILVGYHKDMPWEIAPATILSCQLGKDHRPDICKDDDAEYSFQNRNNTCCILWSGDGIDGIFAGVGPVAMMMIRHGDSL